MLFLKNYSHTLIFISFLILCSIYDVFASEVLRPRGVSLSRAPLYQPDKNFTCLDNSKTIPFTQVNDDYCDCIDASDEPGTSACPHGWFYCTNVGHKPLNIVSSRVNDEVCDCCDGSDEYASRTKCTNTCDELGKYAREQAILREELLKAGKQLKEEFSQKGIQEKQDRKEKLEFLEKNKEEAERVKSEKEKLKNDAEDLENNALQYYRDLEEEENKKKAEIESVKTRSEAHAAFNKYDTNQDGRVSYMELQSHHTFDKDKDGLVSDEEARYFLMDNDEVNAEEFAKDSWSRIKPYLAIEAEDLKKSEELDNVANTENAEEEENNNEEEHQEEEEEDEELEATEGENQEPPASRKYDEETQRLVDIATEARNEFSNAESAVREIETKIKDLREYLDKDFGSDEEYAPLFGECFEYVDHEYIYKLCPFDKTIQQPKSGSLETRLGSWGRWSGPEHNKYESMLYERGQACWNGPQRSTLVNLSCGSENKVTSVTEPNKCEYMFDFTTPAACYEDPSEQGDKGHDEL